MNWKEHDQWNLKTFIALMILEFGVVVWGVKYIMSPFYDKWLNNDFYAGILIGLTITIILMLGIYFIALRPKKLTWQAVGIKPMSRKDWKLVISYTIILMIGTVIITLITSLIGGSWENSKTDAVQENITVITVLIAFISAAIISPIYEEIFYRGFIYRWLRTRIGFKGALLLSALIFAVAHIPTYNTVPAAFFAGSIFSLAYERTQSILPSMLIHGLSNGIMISLTFLG